MNAHRVITEEDLRTVPPGSSIHVPEDAILTPSARDLAAARGIAILRVSRQAQEDVVALGADHGGFEMKETIKYVLAELGLRHHDFGTYSTDPVDYPDFAQAVAESVSTGRFRRGIIVDGAGIGSCMVANKVPGVRAAMCYDVATARNSREHNDANVLTVGAKMISLEAMREVVKTWLTTPVGEERHRRRVEKIMGVERKYLAR